MTVHHVLVDVLNTLGIIVAACVALPAIGVFAAALIEAWGWRVEPGEDVE